MNRKAERISSMLQHTPRILLGFALPFAGAVAMAQTATPASPQTERSPSPLTSTNTLAKVAEPEGDVYSLSPFVVTENATSGYQARKTTSGNRLVTDVQDLGASISIFTKDFLNDIGAKNAQELLVYAPGMDAGGPGGNYAGHTFGSLADSGTTATNQEIRGQSQVSRTRGLASPNYTRGLFTSDIPIDGYNIEGVTVNRGPNAILFGAGSPAGVVDSSLIQAKLSKNETKLENRVGDNSSFRTSLDHNQVIVPGRAALRIAILDDHEKFDQRPAFDDKQRLFVAFNGKLTKTTTLRANIEVGEGQNNRPAQILPFDNITPWLEAGRPVWDPTFYDNPAVNAGASGVSSGTLGANNSATLTPYGYNNTFGQNNIFDQAVIAYANQSATPVGFISTLTSGFGTTANTLRSGLFHPLVNQDSAPDAFNFINTSNLGLITSSGYWAAVGGPANGVRPLGIRLQGFTDYRYFDFAKQQLDTSFYQWEKFHNYNITLEQLAWQNRVGVELAYNREDYKTSFTNLWMGPNNSNYVSIDVTKVLPTGQANPNFGRPMLISRVPARRDTFVENENKRATAFAKWDFKDVSKTLGKWLGSHTLTGLYEEAARTQLINQIGHYASSPSIDLKGSGSTNAGTSIPAFVTYIGPSVLSGPVSLTPNGVSLPQAGLRLPFTYFAAPQGSTAQGDFATEALNIGYSVRDNVASRELVKSQAFVLQSRWLDNHLVTTAGWRRDRDYLARQTVAFNTTSGTYLSHTPSPGQYYYTLDDYAFPSTPPYRIGAETKSWSAVLRWPQKLLRLPAGTDLSVFYNDSENFTPSAARVNVYNQPLASPKGTTKEYGFNLNLLDEKLMLRVSQFETAVKDGALSTQGALDNLIINGIGQSWQAWTQEPNISRPGGAINRSADIAKLLAPLPSNWTSLYQYASSTNATTGLIVATLGPSVSGRTDLIDYVAKGTEVELTFAPTNQWRFMANFSKQETRQMNMGPVAQEFIERMRSTITALANVPKGNYPDLDANGNAYVPGAPLPSNVQTFGQWVEANVYVPYAQLMSSQGAVAAEQPKYRANFVGNYTFAKDSRFSGFSVGVGARWTSKKAIGYPVTRTSAGAVLVEVGKPYWSAEELNFDAWIGYSRKICRDKVLWKVQLNGRNIAGDKDPVAILSQPWGAAAITRLPAEQRVFLTNTFSF